jgi:PAS domain S-box-containing protein
VRLCVCSARRVVCQNFEVADQGGPGPGSEWPRVGTFRFHARENRWEWSDEVARMHGYEPGTVDPTTDLVLSHKHPDDKPTVAELIEQVRRHSVPFSSRHRIIDTKGQTRVVVVVGDRWFDDAGEVIGTTGFYIDVTDEFDADVRQSLDEVVAEIARNRAVINQAMGMLMLAYGTTADKAFDVLAWRSQQTNVKLRHIAAQFVHDATSAELISPEIRDQLDRMLLDAHESGQHSVQLGE